MVGSTATMAITVTIVLVIFCQWSLSIVLDNYKKPLSFYELSRASKSDNFWRLCQIAIRKYTLGLNTKKKLSEHSFGIIGIISTDGGSIDNRFFFFFPPPFSVLGWL